MTSSFFILIQTQMALIILRHVIITIVFCSMTSHAAVSKTYKVAMNATGSKVCTVDRPTTVIPMALRAMRMQCGGKCNEDPSCKLFQMNEDLKQCELFTYLPHNFAAIDHCSAYAAIYTGKHMVFKFHPEFKLSNYSTTQLSIRVTTLEWLTRSRYMDTWSPVRYRNVVW